MARLFLSVALMAVVVVVMSSAQVLVPVESTVEDEPALIESVDQVDDSTLTASGEPRPKRQFLAGLLLGSLVGGHRYGYGYGGHYHRPHYHRPHYHGGYGGYGYGYPYYG